MIKRWRADGDTTLDDALVRIFRDPTALAEGRVFVARARATDGSMPIARGVTIEVGSGQQVEVAPLAILHENDDYIVVDKPAGLVSVPDHHGHDSLQARVAAHRRVPIESVHPTSRLDRGVSGVLVFALSKTGRDDLTAARERGEYSRLYLALAEHGPPCAHGAWHERIGRDAKDPRKRAVNGKESTHASTDYRVLARAPHGVLLALRPKTGRTHQLRVHAAHAGLPLDGDSTYGGRTRIVSDVGAILPLARVGLHAHRVELPWQRGRRAFVAPVPPELRASWRAVGGTDDAWDAPGSRGGS